MYTNTEWDNSKTAAGVVVSDGTHAFVIHPDAESRSEYSKESILIPGLCTTTDRNSAQTDFAGEANTATILTAVADGIISEAPAAQYCSGITFAHGKTGYLPSAGELTLAYANIDAINECLTTIAGTAFDLTGTTYWTSTQASDINSWNWNNAYRYVQTYSKFNARQVRAFSAL